MRDLTCELLEAAGYTVLNAANGHAALALETERGEIIHLLMTDVVMPGMSGRTLAEQLQQRRPGLKVLYMSGYTADVIAQHGVLEPGTLLLEKPFSVDALSHRVREALER